MFHNKSAWEVGCELARSGDYANVIMLERELRRRGLLGAGESVTGSIFRRERLTRVCHAARNGVAEDFAESESDPRPYGFSFSSDAA